MSERPDLEIQIAIERLTWILDHQKELNPLDQMHVILEIAKVADKLKPIYDKYNKSKFLFT